MSDEKSLECRSSASAAVVCPKCSVALTAEQGFCSQCGLRLRTVCYVCCAAVEAEAKFCGRCGASVTSDNAPTSACARCGAELYPGHHYCPHCGTRRVPSCTDCGYLLSPTWAYCPNCGKLLGVEDEERHYAEMAGREIVRSAENEAIAHNDKGVELLEEERFEEAVEEFQKAIDLYPDDSLYHYNLGVAYENLGMNGRAFDAYQRATELDPSNASAFLALGYLYDERGERDAAEKCWHTVIGLAPDSEESDEAREALVKG